MLSRRNFLSTFTEPGRISEAISARGLEAWRGEMEQAQSKGKRKRGGAPAFRPPQPGDIVISGNENPLGPGSHAIEALMGAFGDLGRYPFNSRVKAADLKNTLAEMHGAKTENILLGAGSGEVLRCAVRAFTSAERPLVTAAPSYGSPVATAQRIGTPVKAIPVTDTLELDLEGMAEAAQGAGLVFFCNPNNPTATIHGKQAVQSFIDSVSRSSPETVILFDEAYFHYVTDPSYASFIDLALENPKVFVARTFSKAYGMAGLRLGYGIGRAETMEALSKYKLTFNTNVPVVAAAVASLENPAHIENEGKRNAAARKYTLDFFKEAGVEASKSQANFVLINLGYPAKEFRDECTKQQVLVGRDFPPLEKTHCRVSIGTMEEMEKATKVFAQVLSARRSGTGGGY